MPSNQNGIFVPNMAMPKNCYFCPFMRERLWYFECWVDRVTLSYPDPRLSFTRPKGCPLQTVTSGIVDNMKGDQNENR